MAKYDENENRFTPLIAFVAILYSISVQSIVPERLFVLDVGSQ